MCRSRDPLQCIVPPHMLRTLMESKDRKAREAAFRTIALSAQIRGRREVLGAVRAALPLATAAGKQRTIYDVQHGTSLPGQRVRGEGDPSSSDSAANEAYDGFGATYDLYSEVYGRDSIDDRGMRLVGVVHFGQNYNNAFWDGAQMVFGDGDGEIFTGFTKSLDVIAHELTHGVTEHTASLVYHVQSGALNESFSDVFGSLVKQHKKGETAQAADWLIGAELLAPGINGKALRSMKDPGSAYDDPRLGKDPQPKHMDDYVELPDDPFNDNGGVHINSGIPNHAFYHLATQLGGYAWEDAGAIWYNALLQLWPTAKFEDCANVTTQVAGALYGSGSSQQQAVRNAWDQVGLRVAAPHPAAQRRKKGKAGAPIEVNGQQLKRQLEKLSEELGKTIEVLS